MPLPSIFEAALGGTTLIDSRPKVRPAMTMATDMTKKEIVRKLRYIS